MIDNISFIIKGLGDITPYGETNIDDKNIKNIDSYGVLCENLVYELLQTYHQINRPEYSIQQMAKRSKNVLENLKEMLEEVE